MAVVELEINKIWYTGTTVREIDWDNIRIPLIEWANNTNRNLEQLAKDCFGQAYSLDNDGAPNKAVDLQTQINNIIIGGSAITGTTSDTFTINTDGNGAILSTTGLTGNRTITFPDASQKLVGETATQTLTNKSLTSPTITGTVSGGASYTAPTITGTVGGNATYSAVTLTSPTLSGTITLSGTPNFSGAATWGSVQTFNAGIQIPTSQKLSMNGATGSVYFENTAALQLQTFINNALVWTNTATQNRSNLDLLPNADNTFVLGSGALRWSQLSVAFINATTLSTPTMTSPTMSGTVTLSGTPNFTGAATWASTQTFNGNTNFNATNMFNSTTYFNGNIIGTHFVPDTDIAYDIGTTSKRWRSIQLATPNNPAAVNSLNANSGIKASLRGNAAGGIDTSYNITSATRTSTGHYSILWVTDFATTPSVIGSINANTIEVNELSIEVYNVSTTGCDIITKLYSGGAWAYFDLAYSVQACGLQ